MEKSRVISEYAESLAGRLSFDRSLARRVRQEVEDHLWEAVATNSTGDPLEAQRRAIADFGDAHVIAAQIAVVSLAKQIKKIGVTVVLVIATVFLAMTTRVTWYDLAQWASCEETRALREIVGLIDRSTFWLAVIVGIAAWAYSSSRNTPTTFHPASREQLRRFFLLCSIATGGLIASVICDGVLTALRLPGWEVSFDFMVAIFSMAIEIACAGILVVHIRSITQRMASAAALLSM
jgi:hypothetical protein